MYSVEIFTIQSNPKTVEPEAPVTNVQTHTHTHTQRKTRDMQIQGQPLITNVVH